MSKMINMLTIVVFSLGFLSPAKAQIAVIVNPGNSVENITTADLGEIYSGDMTRWPGGGKIVLVDQKSNKELSDRFYQVILNKTTGKVRQIWIKKMLQGEMPTPEAKESNESVVSFVSRTAGAIGFVEAGSVTEAVKVVSVEGQSLGSDGYPLK